MSNITIGNEKNILFYSDENGQTKVEVILQDENVWLNVNAIATLFDVQRPAIVKHINNIYNDEEFSRKSTCSILEQVDWVIFGKQIVLKSEMENALRYMAVKGYNQLKPEEWNELNRKLREYK